MASFHAGYAASVCIQQMVAQQILHIYYADGDIPASAVNQVIIPVTGRPAVTITSSLFLAEPQLIFHPEATNRVGVSVRFYGTFTFNAPGVVSLTANVTVRATLFCPVVMTEQTDGYRFSIQLNNGVVTDFAIIITDGNNPMNRFGLDLGNPAVAAAIQTMLLMQPDRKIFFTYP